MIELSKAYQEIKETHSFEDNFLTDQISSQYSERHFEIKKYKENNIIDDFIEISNNILDKEDFINYTQNHLTNDLVEEIFKIIKDALNDNIFD